MISQESRWQVTLLGDLRADALGRSIVRFRTQKTASLFAYLAYYTHRSHARDALVELFWPDFDSDAGRMSLRTAIASLRRQLEQPGVPPDSVIIADRSQVRLATDSVATDYAEFDAALKAAAARSGSAREQGLNRAIDVYGGELLPSLYDDWVLAERTALAERYKAALRELSQLAEEAHHLESAVTYALREVSADPLDEEACRHVMRLYAAAGRPGEALRHYDETARIFRKHLDSDPPSTLREFAGRISPVPRARGRAPAVRKRVAHRQILDTSLARSAPIRWSPTSTVPLPLTSFFGREVELGQITSALAGQRGAERNVVSPTTRLLTIQGSGGCGKTRLCIEAARRLVASYNGRVWFVPLAAAAQPELICNAILSVMSAPDTATISAELQVERALADTRTLLVLDNFEHLVDFGAPLLERLLTAAPGLVCLVSSRTRLSIAGERVLILETLLAPEHADMSPVQLLEYPSVQLFVDRAQAARADFQITAKNAGTVAKLCRALEGLPLSIELAASWAQTLTPGQMLERMDRRLDLLTGRSRGQSTRHGSLRMAIEWSYQLLPDDIKQFYAQLGVLRGGWSAAAAAAMSSPNATEGPEGADLHIEPDLPTMRVLRTLVESSLISPDDSVSAQVRGQRYKMLEVLREFALEQLGGANVRAANERHAKYFTMLAEWYAKLPVTEQRDQLAGDYENLLAALRFTTEQSGYGVVAARLASAMYHVWIRYDRLVEGVEWLDRAIAVAPAGSSELATTLNAAGNLSYYLNDGEATVRYHSRNLAIRKALGEAFGAGKALGNLGLGELMLGNFERSKEMFQQAVALMSKHGSPSDVAGPVNSLAEANERLGDYDAARRLYHESLQLYSAAGHTAGAAMCYSNLAALAVMQNELESARDLYRQSISIMRDRDDKVNLSKALVDLADIEESTGHAEVAKILRSERDMLINQLRHTLPG